MLQCLSGETTPLLDFLAGRSRYGLHKGKVTLLRISKIVLNAELSFSISQHSLGFSGGCLFRAEFAMAVEGRISLSELSNSLCKTELSCPSWWTGVSTTRTEQLANSEIPFSSLELCSSRLENILFTFPFRVTDK